MMDVRRPIPSGRVTEPIGAPVFEPSPELEAWVRATFIDEGAVLCNEEHAHLRDASLGFLWTNVGNERRGRRIIGQCELGEPRGTMGKWARARAEAQILEWFRAIPDFIITIDAGYAAHVLGDAEFMALCEHELLHAAQDTDQYGQPKFRRSGEPVYALRGHDIEEFVSVVRRYGAEATGITELIKAAKAGPEIAPARIAQACGTCLSRAA